VLRIESNTYITREEILAFGVHPETLRKYILRARNAGSHYWQCIQVKGQKVTLYRSIPADVRRKYNMPDPDLVDAQEAKEQARPYEQRIASMIEEALSFGYLDYMQAYDTYPQATQVELAKAAAVAHVGIKVRSEKDYAPKLAYYVEQVQNLGLRYLKISSPDYARKRLKVEDKKSAACELIGIRNEGNNNRTKWSEWDRAHMELLYARTAAISMVQIHAYMQHLYIDVYGLPEEKVPTVPSINYHLQQPKVQAAWAKIKHGSAWAYRHYTTPAQRVMALHANDLWMMDGTRLMLWYNKAGKPAQLNVYLIIDVYSGCIVGYSIDEYESRLSIAKALQMAIVRHQVLPYELMHDNASGHKTANIQRLVQNTEALGMTWTPSPVGKPQYKAQVERIFGTLQTRWMSLLSNYAGEGIISTRKGARPNPEHIDKLFAKKAAGLPDREKLEADWAEMVGLHNTQPRLKDGLSPLQLYTNNTAPLAIRLNPAQRNQMVIEPRLITVRQACIRVTDGKTTHQYLLGHGMSPTNAAALARQWEGKQVKVLYDSEAPDIVDVYSLDDRPICAAHQPAKVLGSKAAKASELPDGLHAYANHTRALEAHDERHRQQAAKLVGDSMDELLDPELWRRVHKDQLNSAETRGLLQYHRALNDPETPIEQALIAPEITEEEEEISLDPALLRAHYARKIQE
jgi:transposase InsO family protein